MNYQKYTSLTLSKQKEFFNSCVINSIDTTKQKFDSETKLIKPNWIPQLYCFIPFPNLEDKEKNFQIILDKENILSGEIQYIDSDEVKMVWPC